MDVRYLQMKKKHESFKGLSERELRKNLESQGWQVWRSDCLNIINGDVYPNVRRKYVKLSMLLHKNNFDFRYLQFINKVHHGMPDFICYRKGVFKFVECKLKYEQLSKLQKKCIKKLNQLGFVVEVHKLVDHRTKTILADVDIENGNKEIREKQMRLCKSVMPKKPKPLYTTI